MKNTGNDGTPEPDNEDNNERQQEQQDDEDRRRPTRTRLSYDITGEPVVVNEQVLYQPTRPVPAAASVPEKSDALPSNWQEILAERLGKLTDKERADFDSLLDVARQRDENVSPNYQLELAALLNKPLNKVAFGSDLDKLDRREEYRAYVRDQQTLLEAHTNRQRSTEQTRTPAPGEAKPEAAKTTPDREPERPLQPAPRQQPSRPAASHDADAQRQHPSPRKAAPDQTTLARRRISHLLHQHAQTRRELNLPLSREAQNEFARLNSQQEAERKTLVDRHNMAIDLLDCQHVGEQAAVAYRWLARDLKQRSSPEADGYEQQSKDLLRVAGRAYEQRQALAAHHADPHGWDRAAFRSTYAPPSQTQDGPARSTTTAMPSSQPMVAPAQPQDPTVVFKDASGDVLTVDRLRAMLGRYQELRQNLGMPSGPNETNEQSRLATAQSTVRTNLLAQQDARSQLLAQKHLGERAGTSSQWMAHDTHQLRYRDDARRAFALAKRATARLDAIDPRTAAQDRTRAINNGQEYSRQSAAQEAAKGGRTLSAEERANLPAQAARGAREPGKETGARMQGAKPGLPRTGRGGPIARGGGGRGR